MKCEMCEKEQEGFYGSGRFCSPKCARSFSTSKNRDEIHKKISNSLKGRKNPNKKKRSFASIQKQKESIKKYYVEMRKSKPFEELGRQQQKKILLEENDSRCSECGIKEEWNGKILKFEFHHIDGNRKNKTKENCRMMCPNCHSQTDNDRFLNKHHTEEAKIKIRLSLKKRQTEKILLAII